MVAVVILRAIGGGSQMGDEIRWGLATLIAAAAFFVPTLIVNLLFAPAKIAQQQHNEVERLQKEAISYKANKDVSDGLANLYRTLSGLISEKITSTKQFEAWGLKRDEWWADAVVYIDHNISHSESVLFSSVSFVRKDSEKVTFLNQYNEVHCRGLISLRVLSEKLEKLMTRYDKAIDSSG